MNTEIIPFWLRDVYARVEPRPIFELQGATSISAESEQEALKERKKGFQRNHLFLRGNDLMRYLWYHPNAEICTGTVTLVIPGLRSAYWDRKYLLSKEEQADLQFAIRETPPKFHDLYEYLSLAEDEALANMSEFQLIGTITPFDVVHLPVALYLQAIESDRPIEVSTSELRLQFDFKAYDFWDGAQKRLLNRIEACSV